MNYLYPVQPNRIYEDADHFLKSKEYIAEPKKDGWRCLVHGENDTITLYTRHKTLVKGESSEPQLLSLKQKLLSLFKDWQPFMIDGELLQWRSPKEKGKIYLFDIIIKNGHKRGSMQLESRRQPLFDMDLPHIPTDGCPLLGTVFIPKVYTHDFLDTYREIIKQPSIEGIVLKKIDSQYPVVLKENFKFPFWVKLRKG
ncbi:MAG: RNA ligase family protein [Candidatus Paceibacterota bacterium]|jgi:ATP-dependent DNA ligase